MKNKLFFFTLKLVGGGYFVYPVYSDSSTVLKLISRGKILLISIKFLKNQGISMPLC